MLQRLVANWLRQQAQEAFAEGFDRGDSSQPNTAETSDVVVVFPSAAEAGGLVDKLAGTATTKCNGFTERRGLLNETSVAVVEAPVTHDLLARVIQDAINVHKPDWLVASGFCVALDKGLQRGGMLMADEIVDGAGYSLKTGLQVDARALPKGVYVDTLLTKTGPLAEEHSSKAIAVDQQAAIVAEVCRVQKTKMLSVHAVAGGASDRAPVVEQIQKQSSMVAKIGAATGALLEQPGSLKYLLKDKEKTLRLSDRLANYLVGVIEQICKEEQ